MGARHEGQTGPTPPSGGGDDVDGSVARLRGRTETYAKRSPAPEGETVHDQRLRIPRNLGHRRPLVPLRTIVGARSSRPDPPCRGPGSAAARGRSAGRLAHRVQAGCPNHAPDVSLHENLRATVPMPPDRLDDGSVLLDVPRREAGDG